MNAEVLRADDPVILPHLGSIGCKDVEFRARLRRSIEDNQRILDRLAQ